MHRRPLVGRAAVAAPDDGLRAVELRADLRGLGALARPVRRRASGPPRRGAASSSFEPTRRGAWKDAAMRSTKDPACPKVARAAPGASEGVRAHSSLRKPGPTRRFRSSSLSLASSGAGALLRLRAAGFTARAGAGASASLSLSESSNMLWLAGALR